MAIREISIADAKNNGQIDDEDYQAIIKSANGLSDEEQIKVKLGNAGYITTTMKQLKELQNKNQLNTLQAQPASGADVPAPTPGAAQTSADTANANLKTLQSQIEEQLKIIAENKNEAAVEAAQERIAALLPDLKQMNNLASNKLTADQIAKYETAAGNQKPMSGHVNMGTSAGGVAAQTLGQGANAGKAQTMSGGFAAPAQWGAQVMGGVPTTSAAYGQAMVMEDDMLASWDQVNDNTNKGKQLMMLFFYYARMAESGDMGAMYQFMKFITFIVSKDKAKQQIEMGKKLIALQELSRSWTNKLLQCSTNANDASASNELMKTMTIVKSETDAIATSQKLISQMMEEFSQVVETLTNVTKGACEAEGRIMRTVSRMNG